jgi:V/A-type H+-transporting ATPase subunit I
MIVEMSKLRILGPEERLPEALQELQDVGTIHLVEPEVEHPLLERRALAPAQVREARCLRSACEDASRIVKVLGPLPPSLLPFEMATRGDVARRARWTRRLRRRVDQLTARMRDLEEERALVSKYRDLFTTYQALFDEHALDAARSTYCLVLKDARKSVLEKLRATLQDVAGTELEMRFKTVSSGEAAIVLSVPTAVAGPIEKAFSRAGVHEVPVPPSYGGRSVAEAVPRLLSRLDAIPGELSDLEAEIGRLRESDGAAVLGARAAFHDRLARIESLPLARVTRHAFILDGWAPENAVSELEARLAGRLEGRLDVETLDDAASSAPVALSNPGLFRPFEALVKFLPLPRYGTIDPTPYVAVFFPMFFGLILGDVGYGVVLGLLAFVLARRASPDSILASLARIAGACAVFSVVFGLLYGELFGDLGHRLLGMPSLWFRREEALLPFLFLALALGFVHVLLGLVLGVFGALKHHRRQALGRGVAAVMIVLILVALLAAVEVLPEAFFTPAVVALLVAFPVLVVVEGLLAPIELLASVSNVFSYARIMAIGTASVMMAVVANRMVGAVGSVVVGTLFALLFHLVNFVLGVFSPTIHALRLHYVEFFGKFYRPGGADYAPLRHWGTGVRPARK